MGKPRSYFRDVRGRFASGGSSKRGGKAAGPRGFDRSERRERMASLDRTLKTRGVKGKNRRAIRSYQTKLDRGRVTPGVDKHGSPKVVRVRRRNRGQVAANHRSALTRAPAKKTTGKKPAAKRKR